MTQHPPRPGRTAAGLRRPRGDRDASGLLQRATRSSAVRYLAVGGSAFLVDLGLLALLHEVLGVQVGVAGAVAFLVSFAYTYSMQRFAFASQTPHGGALVRYSVLVGFNTLATGLIVQLLSTSAIGWVGAKVVATAVTTVWNYFFYKHWVFPRTDEGSRTATAEEA